MQLKRCHTMKRAFEFAHVRTQGASHAGRFLVLSAAPLPGAAAAEQHSRFGIITTKRVGCAVCRNLLRRRVRELLRAHAGPLAVGLCVVVILRQRAAGAPFAALERDLRKLICRAALDLCPQPPPC